MITCANETETRFRCAVELLIRPTTHDDRKSRVMIPFTTRAARKRTETTLLSYSRQRLPRPARLYSTPTKRSSAPVLDTLHPKIPDSYPAFLPALPTHADPASNVQDDPAASDVHSFLRTRTPYMVLPPPLPSDRHSEINDLYYTDSPTRDMIAVMDACLHNCHDVQRAKEIFDDLRAKRSEQILHPRLYTAFVEAYLEMALKEPERKALWVDDAWILLDSLFNGQEKVAATTGAYALALIAWLRFVCTSPTSSCFDCLKGTPLKTRQRTSTVSRAILQLRY